MWILPVVSGIILIAVDQFTKYIAYTKLKPIDSVTVIKGAFNLTYVENRGAAFGILQEGRWFFVALTMVILAGIIYYYNKLPKEKPYKYIRATLVLISAGAIGNCIDRLLNGYVVDFLHATFIDFPVFNMADIYVVMGTVVLAIILVFFIKEDGTENKGEISDRTEKSF